MQIFISHFVFRRQPAEFFFSKKFVKWKHAKPIFSYRLIPMASVRLEFWPSLTSWTKALMLKKFLRINCYLCEGAMWVWLIGLKKISKAERISSWPLNLNASFSSVIPVIGTWSGSSHVFTISEPTIFFHEIFFALFSYMIEVFYWDKNADVTVNCLS